MRRVAQKEPPGYKDKDKEGRHQAGDYLVWEQTLQEAQHRGVPVLFVTEDVKEDWWLEVHGQRRGPRPELVDEMRSRADVQLLMSQTVNLLRLARELLAIEVPETAVEDLTRVTSSRSTTWNVEATDDNEEFYDGEGWTREGLDELLRRL